MLQELNSGEGEVMSSLFVIGCKSYHWIMAREDYQVRLNAVHLSRLLTD